MRGAWEEPGRLTLLRNKGDGAFEDVTAKSGLDEPISTESSAWGDYDNDGWLDLFVCGEAHAKSPHGRCRLYHNEHDGTFKDVAVAAGVTNERYSKGSAWGDYDGDGRLDLFVSNMGQECRLYHNEGGGKFKDVARELGVTGGPKGFSCWFFDYDNDGWLDLWVNDYNAGGAEVVAHYLGITAKAEDHPRLYHNLQGKGFRDVSLEAGLDWPIMCMGANFGDIDNDGYLDAYFGTGGMNFSELIPNVMLKNVDGRRFEDVTESSHTGHLQKGHGVSFADWDCDGDLDIFVELGGGFPGDQSYNVLFQNPGHGRHGLKVKLVGTRTNRSAMGAPDPGRGQGGRWPDPVDLSGDRQQRQLRRQLAGRADRPRRREVRLAPDRHLADQPDDPGLPGHRRRPVHCDHRGNQRVQGPPPDSPQATRRLMHGPRGRPAVHLAAPRSPRYHGGNPAAVLPRPVRAHGSPAPIPTNRFLEHDHGYRRRDTE